MNTATRPLELRLRSELDRSGTIRIENESRNAVVGQLARSAKLSRLRLWAVIVPIAFLAAATAGFFIAY